MTTKQATTAFFGLIFYSIILVAFTISLYQLPATIEPKTVIKNSCWKQTIPHINVWEPMKCPINNTPIKRTSNLRIKF